jgi:hypothetical protein
MRSLARTVAVSLVIPVTGAVAHAATSTYDFTATGTRYGDISFSLPASPTPDSFNRRSFELDSVPLIVDGDPVTEDIRFFTSHRGGGARGDGVRAKGPQLFTGPTWSPTFLTGNYHLRDFILTISDPGTSTDPGSSSVPEPSSLFLFGTGLFAVCGLIRKKLSGGITRA